MFFLGDYILMPVMLMVFLFLLIPIMIVLGGKKRNFISVKAVWIIEASLLISSIIVSYYLYQSTKAELKKHFLENRDIVCNYKKENIIIKKDANYILKDDYFIKDSVAIDMDNCKSLEE